MKRFISGILTALLAAVLLLTSSCTGGIGEPTGTDDETTLTPETTASPESVLVIAEGGKSDYKIIFPENDGECMKLAESFAGRVKSSYGVRPESGYDFLLPGREPGEKEILIGPTNRAESQEVLSGLRYGEYAVKIVGSKIVVCGNGTEATRTAMALFEKTVFSGSGDVMSFSSKNEILSVKEYPIASFNIGGRSIGDFSICVPADSGAASYLAKFMVNRISSRTGFTLPVIEGKNAENGCEIRIGIFDDSAMVASGSYSVYVQGTVLTATAADVGGLIDAFYCLRDDVLGIKEKNIELDDSSSWTGKTTYDQISGKDSSVIRVVYQNVLGYETAYPTGDRADIAYDFYMALDADVYCFEEASSSFRSGAALFYKRLPANHLSEICYSSDGGTGNPIYYRTDRLELVESGYKKSRSGDKGTTFAVFRRKSDSKLFAVTNSHFAANSNAGGDATLGNTYRVQDAGALVEVVGNITGKYSGIYLVMGGDYNSVRGSEPYNEVKKSGAEQVRDTLGAWDIISPFHAHPEIDQKTGVYSLYSGTYYLGTNSIDHIFTLGSGFKPLSYTVVDNTLALTTSDHTMHYIDLIPAN